MNHHTFKLLLFLALSCCALNIAAQQDTPLVFRLEGVVTDCQNKVPIENVIISVLSSDGYLDEVRTDRAGYYSVRLWPGLSYVVSTDAKNAFKTSYAERYLNSPAKGKLTTIGQTESKIFKKDFCLTPSYGCGMQLPYAFFKKNSIDYSNTMMDRYYGHPDSGLVYFLPILADNPSIVLELSGHADSSERDRMQLSLERAEKVRAHFIRLGVDSARLVCKGYGSSKMLVKEKEVKVLKAKAKRDSARSRNMRVGMRVARWDYQPPGMKYKIEGRVIDSNREPVNKAIVQLLLNDSVRATVLTDKDGYYSYELNPGAIYTVACSPPYIDKSDPCWAYKVDKMYLNSSKKVTINTTHLVPSSLQRIEDFVLPVACWELRFPALHFEKNSLDYLKMHSDPCYGWGDSTVLFFFNTLELNPSIVIELSGHASSNESKAQVLSEQRAMKVKDTLVKMGIPADRVICKGYSYKKLLVKDAEIAKLKTSEEKEKMHSRNRRVVFKVLAWEYPAPQSSPPPGIREKPGDEAPGDGEE